MGPRRISLAGIICLAVIAFAGFLREASALTTEEEKKLGKKIFQEMEGRVEIVRDVTLQTFLNRMGRSLVAHAGPTPFDFKFCVVKAQDPNAFAVPGGYIFVATGLIVLADNDHELAGVLSHEIAHVTGRHVSQLIERSQRLSIATLAAMIAGALIGGGGKTTEAVTAMSMATAEALTLKYTREMEKDADQNSLHIIARSGYDPTGLISFLSKIGKPGLFSMPKVPAYLLTHPETEQRISLIENLLKIEPKPAGPFKSSPDFRKIQMKAFVEEREAHVAVSHFESMIQGNPQDAEGYFGLGIAYQKAGRSDRSIEAYQRGLSLAQGDFDLLRELGIAYFSAGKMDLAIRIFESLQGMPGEGQWGRDLSPLYHLAKAYQEKGDAAKALPLFLRFQKEMPEFSAIQTHLGSVYGRLGQKGLSHYHFGRHFKERGDRTNALLHYRTALQWLERGTPEREEAEREIKELSRAK